MCTDRVTPGREIDLLYFVITAGRNDQHHFGGENVQSRYARARVRRRMQFVCTPLSALDGWAGVLLSALFFGGAAACTSSY